MNPAIKLFRYIKNNDLELTEELLKKGFGPEYKGAFNISPLLVEVCKNIYLVWKLSKDMIQLIINSSVFQKVHTAILE